MKNGAAKGATGASVEAVLTRVVRDEAGRLTAALVRLLGDFALAEDLVQDAVVIALRRWPETGVPDDPAGWLLATRQHPFLGELAEPAGDRGIVALLVT